MLSLPSGLPSFIVEPKERSYKHQYANIYFIRLHILREFVEKKAVKLWKGLDGNFCAPLQSVMVHDHHLGNPVAVPRVLEVTKGQLCYIIGTVYMDMPLKPNVLEDIARDVRLTMAAFYFAF